MAVENLLKLSPIVAYKWLKHMGFHPASPSGVHTADTCHRMWDSKYLGHTVDRVAFRDSIHNLFGSETHLDVEDFLTGKKDSLNLELATRHEKDGKELPNYEATILHYAELMDSHTGMVEFKLARNAEGGTGWDERTIGCIVDLGIDISDSHRYIIDWKTNGTLNAKGEYRSPYPKPFQLEMAALLSFIENPELQRVTGVFEFLCYGFNYTYEFRRDRVFYTVTNGKGKTTKKDYLYPILMERFWSMQERKTFHPKQSPLCKAWCSVASCEHNGRTQEQIDNDEH